MLFACEHHAFQIALPTGQRRGSVLPSSRGDRAREAFEKLTKPALPGTHHDLARAIEREARVPRPRRGTVQRLDEFVGRVAEREGVPHNEALEHVCAVIATLRDALPPKALSDLLAQLPRG